MSIKQLEYAIIKEQMRKKYTTVGLVKNNEILDNLIQKIEHKNASDDECLMLIANDILKESSNALTFKINNESYLNTVSEMITTQSTCAIQEIAKFAIQSLRGEYDE